MRPATATTRRLVLFPHGQPRVAAHAELCAELYVELGGDVSRVIDGPFANLDRFIDHLNRVRIVSEGLERAVVVLTRTNPLGLMVLDARRKIQTAIPPLRQALWCLFVDPQEDPFFLENARKLGSFQRHPQRGIAWRVDDSELFYLASTVPLLDTSLRRRTADVDADPADGPGLDPEVLQSGPFPVERREPSRQRSLRVPAPWPEASKTVKPPPADRKTTRPRSERRSGPPRRGRP